MADADHPESAYLEIPGSNFRNIALNAAFLAAGEFQLINMAYLSHAARREYIEIDKMITSAEFGTYFQQAVHKLPG